MEEQEAYLWATFCFFAGMVLLRLISYLVHLIDKDHHAYNTDAIDEALDTSQAQAEVTPAGEGTGQPPPQVAGAADPEMPQQKKISAAEAREIKEKRDAKQ